MEITSMAAAVMAMKQAQLQQNISIEVMKQAMETQQQTIKLLGEAASGSSAQASGVSLYV